MDCPKLPPGWPQQKIGNDIGNDTGNDIGAELVTSAWHELDVPVKMR